MKGMKGITPIVAIIILLLITIALAGAAFTYLSGYFDSLTAKAIQISDPSCTGTGIATLIVRNIGRQQVNIDTNCVDDGTLNGNIGGVTSKDCDDITLLKSTGGDFNGNFSNQVINVGESVIFIDGCDGVCNYRFSTGAGFGSATASVLC